MVGFSETKDLEASLLTHASALHADHPTTADVWRRCRNCVCLARAAPSIRFYCCKASL
jgi:hypothetical protein